jgi:ribonuclease PH
MVQQALNHLKEENIVDLDEEKKAAMVNNMMVVLTGEHGVTPVVNTGTLYS